jgi:hypothetical protein
MTDRQQVGESSVSAFLRLVRFTKTTALISALWTILCSVLLAGRQGISWWREGLGSPYSLAALIKGDREITYTTASYTEKGILDWVLDLPAIVPLLMAATLLLALYSWLATIEKQTSTIERQAKS